ncbi:hypothetical protein SLS57_007979 [Botryosphaeria dothidea]
MPSSSFKSTISITHIGTATAILSIDGINFLTDPFFSPAGTEHDAGIAILKNTTSPALTLAQLPPIDAVLLSHEDHWDNLDTLGRQLLDGRRVLTTRDGAKNLAPRPGVVGLAPWQTLDLVVAGGGTRFRVTGIPCAHLPGGECTGFVLECAAFGADDDDGKPNAVYFSGDTVYVEEAARGLRARWNVVVALLNLGRARVPLPGGQGPLQVTMDGAQAARLCREVGVEVLVPMHFESWGHFTQFGGELREVFEEEGVAGQVCWLEPGVEKRVF